MSYKIVDDTEILADLREPCGHGQLPAAGQNPGY